MQRQSKLAVVVAWPRTWQGRISGALLGHDGALSIKSNMNAVSASLLHSAGGDGGTPSAARCEDGSWALLRWKLQVDEDRRGEFHQATN